MITAAMSTPKAAAEQVKGEQAEQSTRRLGMWPAGGDRGQELTGITVHWNQNLQ